MRPLTFHRPKSMLPVANRPFLEYQISLLKKHGIREITLATNYLWEYIEAHFGDGSAFDIDLRFAFEPEPLGTAGAIRNAIPPGEAETVIVLNGDVLTDFDLGSIIRFHQENGADATIAVRTSPRPHGFGVLASDDSGRVNAWREPSEEEKKRAASAVLDAEEGSDFINAGIYILEPSFIARIPTGQTVSIERETFQNAIAGGDRVFAVAPEGYWLDIGSPRQYLEANLAAIDRQLESDLALRPVAESAVVFEGADVEGSVIGPDCVISPGARIRGSVLLEGVGIGENVQVFGSILDSGCALENDAKVCEGAVLGAGSRITRGSMV